MGTSTCLPNLGPEGNDEEELLGKGEEENEFPENAFFEGKLENEFKFEELEDEDEKTFEFDDDETILTKKVCKLFCTKFMTKYICDHR